jgi:hypothetical protein
MPPLTTEQLLAVCYAHYPRHLDYADPQHEASPETQRLRAALAAAMQDHSRYRQLVTTLRDRHPELGWADWTYLRREPGYIFIMTTTPVDESTKQWTTVVACISVIAPVYFIYAQHLRDVDGREVGENDYRLVPEAQWLVDEMAREIEAVFSYVPLTREQAFTRVPELRINDLAEGEATIFDCLFTSREHERP